MSVPRGTIYGLLGPSGCCKTTLLRCIVGRLKPRHGTVTVFGHKPGTKESGIPGPNIGYMPQELSLISQFTVRETLEYYAGFAHSPDLKGAYHCDRKQDLNLRIEFLLKLLDISDFEHVFTDRLSGGQKRRVSLAVAMINDPPLLILDEPTVGVDPIVRDAIWSYLVEQSRNGLTIIVTTHYIEEAASAHKVGFMRQGRILAEGNPEALMSLHKVPTLESLFLKLSRQDDVTRYTNSDDLYQIGIGTGSNSIVKQHHQINNHHQNLSTTTTTTTTANHMHIQLNHRNHGSNSFNETQFNTNGKMMDHHHHSIAYSNGNCVKGLPLLPPADYDHPTTIVEYNNNEPTNNEPDLVISSASEPMSATYHINNNNNHTNNYANGSMTSAHQSPPQQQQQQQHESGNANGMMTTTTSMSLVNATSSSKFDTLNGKSKLSRKYSIHSQAHRVNSFQKIGVLCRKHRLRLFRRVSELVITMLLPALEVALFCLCMGRDPTAIQMAVCNQEKPPFMSLVFLKSIDPDFIQLKYYDTPEEAIDSVRNADTYSAIVLAKNFTSSMQQFASKVYPELRKNNVGETASTIVAKFLHGGSQGNGLDQPGSPMPLPTPFEPTSGMLDTPPGQSSTSTPMPPTTTTTLGPVTAIPINSVPVEQLTDVDDSIIKIYYDGSNALHVNIIRRELFSAIFRFVEQLGKLIGHAGIANQLPIRFEKPIYGTEKTDMIEFVGPGLMVFIVFFATMSITSMAFLSERREGTLERSLIVGMTPTEFIISQIINITFLLVVQITLTVVMGFWIFSFPMKGSYFLAVAMMFCQGLCGMTYGLMLSAICTNEMTALMLGAGSQLMFCFITGIFWPVDTMIPFLRYFSYMMPQTLPMESFRHILIRGFGLSRSAVWNGYVISVGWIIFFLILAIVIFRIR